MTAAAAMGQTVTNLTHCSTCEVRVSYLPDVRFELGKVTHSRVVHTFLMFPVTIKLFFAKEDYSYIYAHVNKYRGRAHL